MGKEEIARKEQCLLFPQCFLLNQIIVPIFVHIFDIMFLFAAELEEPKIGISGKVLNTNDWTGVEYLKITSSISFLNIWRSRTSLKRK